MLRFHASMVDLSKHMAYGLVALDLIPPTCELYVSMRDGRGSGQHLFGWEDKLRLNTQRATVNDIALGGLFVAAGMPWEARSTRGILHNIITDPPNPLSAHERLTGIGRTLPLLTQLGWRPGMALAELASAAFALEPNVAWRQPDHTDSSW
jgi:hypothetical protein